MATISKGIKLLRNGTPLKDLQNIPELGNAKEAIEITTLDDAARKYTDGIENYGDSIPFTFLYKKEQFTTLQTSTESDVWKVQLPDDTYCTFKGKGTVKLAGVGVNGALTYTLNIRPASALLWNEDLPVEQA